MILIRDTILSDQMIVPNLEIIECLGITVNKARGSPLLKLILLYLPGRMTESELGQHYENDLNKLCYMGQLNTRKKWELS